MILWVVSRFRQRWGGFGEVLWAVGGFHQWWGGFVGVAVILGNFVGGRLVSLATGQFQGDFVVGLHAVP